MLESMLLTGVWLGGGVVISNQVSVNRTVAVGDMVKESGSTI